MIKFTQKAVAGQCRARRCMVGEELVGFRKGQDPAVFLCPKHLDQAQGESRAADFIQTYVTPPDGDVESFDGLDKLLEPELLTDTDHETKPKVFTYGDSYSVDGRNWYQGEVVTDLNNGDPNDPIYSLDGGGTWDYGTVVECVAPALDPEPEPVAPAPEPPPQPLVEEEFHRATIVQVDHAPVLALVTPVRDQCTKVSAELVSIVIDSQEAYNATAALGAGVQAQLSKLEKRRKEIVQPLVEGQREINALFKMASEPGAEVKQMVKDALGDYTKRMQVEKLAQLRAGNHQAALAVPEVVQPAGTYTKSTWKWRQTGAFELVPDEFKILNAPALDAVIKATKDQTKIPGIEAYLDEQVIVKGVR